MKMDEWRIQPDGSYVGRCGLCGMWSSWILGSVFVCYNPFHTGIAKA